MVKQALFSTLLACGALAVGSCARSTPTPTTIAAIGGDGQIVAPTSGEAFFGALVFLVTDANNTPVPGVTITVACTDNNPRCYLDNDKDSIINIQTDANGLGIASAKFCVKATCTYHGAKVIGMGSVPVNASLATNPAVETTATLTVAQQQVLIWAGNRQSTTSYSNSAGSLWGFEAAPQVEVLDTQGNPLANQNVTFSCAGPAGSLCSFDMQSDSTVSTTTDVNGIATALEDTYPLYLNQHVAAMIANAPGAYTVTAAVGGQNVTFTETALANTRRKRP